MKTTLIVLFISVISVIAKKIHRIPKGKEKKKLRGVTFKTKRITQRGSGSCPLHYRIYQGFLTETGNDPCADSQAIIGVDSCTGSNACQNTDGNIGARSCQGEWSCTENSLTVKTIGDDSCHGSFSCLNYNSVAVGQESCIGGDSCFYAGGTVGEHSCIGENSCSYTQGTVGDQSCIGERSCYRIGETVGDHSCIGESSCYHIGGTVGDHSCTSAHACEDHEGDIPSNCPSVAAMNNGLCNSIPLLGLCDLSAPRCVEGLSCIWFGWRYVHGWVLVPKYHCCDPSDYNTC